MLEARPAAMAPRVNGFRDANGRLSMNAHQWLGICAYASLVLGFYLLQAPALEDSTTRLALEICYGAIALVAVGSVGAVAMALLAKTIGEEMLAWDKLSSARRRSLMFRTSRSLGSLPRAGRSQELPRWEVDPSGVCVCRSSNS